MLNPCNPSSVLLHHWSGGPRYRIIQGVAACATGLECWKRFTPMVVAIALWSEVADGESHGSEERRGGREL